MIRLFKIIWQQGGTGKFAIGQLLIIVALVGVNIWNRNTIANLRDWQEAVLVAVSTAADVRTKDGKPATLRAKDAVAQIRIFGQFRDDVLGANATARLRQAARVQAVEAEAKSRNQENVDAYEAKLAAARRVADQLRSDLMRASAATSAYPGGHRKADMSALSNARRAPDAPASPDGLPDPAKWQPAMNLYERLLATEQALQLEALINSVSALGAIDPNASQNERALPQ